MHSKVFLIIVQYIRMYDFFSEMAEYAHTYEGSSYRLVQTPMNWLDAQVNAVALSFLFRHFAEPLFSSGYTTIFYFDY